MYAKNIAKAFMAEVYKAGSPQLMAQYAEDKMRRLPPPAIGRKLQRLARYYFATKSGKMGRWF